MLVNFEDIVLKELEELKDDATKIQIFKWALKFKKYHRDESPLEEGKLALWSLTWGQASDLTMKRKKIKSDADFSNQEKDKGCV